MRHGRLRGQMHDFSGRHVFLRRALQLLVRLCVGCAKNGRGGFLNLPRVECASCLNCRGKEVCAGCQGGTSGSAADTCVTYEECQSACPCPPPDKGPLIVGGVVGGLAALGLLIFLIWLIRKCNKHNGPVSPREMRPARLVEMTSPQAVQPQMVQPQMVQPQMVQPQMVQPQMMQYQAQPGMMQAAPGMMQAAPVIGTPQMRGRFDTSTGKELPRFDPATGVQNW